MEREHTAVGELFARIVIKFGQAKGWIGKKQRAVRAIDEVVRAIEPLTVVTICQDPRFPVFSHAGDPTIAMFVDREPALRIQSQSIRAGLQVLSDVLARV